MRILRAISVSRTQFTHLSTLIAAFRDPLIAGLNLLRVMRAIEKVAARQ